MANTNLKDGQSNVISQLGTYTRNVLIAGLHNIRVTCQVASIPSSLSIVINLNGSPIASSVAPSAAQEEIDIQINAVPCVVNDVITIVYSSSAVSDSLPQAFKSIAIVVQSI